MTRPITVLVVEDEPLILLNALDMIEDAGMVALDAASAPAALKLLESNEDIEIIFSDIDLPGTMDGLDLALLVRERWPQMALLLTSGHMMNRSIQIPDGGAFLPKPYQPDALIAYLQRLTAASDSP